MLGNLICGLQKGKETWSAFLSDSEEAKSVPLFNFPKKPFIQNTLLPPFPPDSIYHPVNTSYNLHSSTFVPSTARCNLFKWFTTGRFIRPSLNLKFVVQSHGSQCVILRALGWHPANVSLAGYVSACKYWLRQLSLYCSVRQWTRIFDVQLVVPQLTFRHRASCIFGQAFHYSPENAYYIFNQQIYFINWYLLDRASLI